MKLVVCTACGSRELTEEAGYVVCLYCQSRFVPQADEVAKRETVVGLQSDVEALLRKCEEEPANRKRYAHLILDIDPTNQEALRHLR